MSNKDYTSKPLTQEQNGLSTERVKTLPEENMTEEECDQMYRQMAAFGYYPVVYGRTLVFYSQRLMPGVTNNE